MKAGELLDRETTNVANSSFREVFDQYDWNEVEELIYTRTEEDVAQAMQRAGNCSPSDFISLISPAAEIFLEEMAQLSHRLTKKRFGNVIQMYIPMYLSNECQNICTYCGFSFDNKIERLTLN